MRGIYVNWRPHRDVLKPQTEFSDFNLLTMVLSSLKFRSFGNTTKFYCDSYTVSQLELLHLMDVWDEYDSTSLDLEINQEEFDPALFFAIGKFFALSHETSPVMVIDIDLILWQDPNRLVGDNKLAFTHWETAHPTSAWYCSKKKLVKPDSFKLRPEWSFKLPAVNTSTIYFADANLKSYYLDQSIQFMRKNPASSVTAPIRSEPYFVEQRLLLMCSKELGLLDLSSPLIDTTWSPQKGAFTKKDNTLGWWDFFLPEPEQRITHTWIAKSSIEASCRFRTYYCCRMIEEIIKLSPSMEKVLREIPDVGKYFLLLDKFGGLDQLIQANLASRILYE